MTDATGELLDFRARKDAFFRTPDSPLSAGARANFAGLAYYSPNEAYRVLAGIERLGGELVELGTTTGELRAFVRYGAARFELLTGAARLTLYAQPGEEEPARLFVPFRDSSSGSETYGAGRYLDAELHGAEPDQSLALLDFNFAYFPYCAYGEGWSCPLPPRENWLDIAVRAGERNP